MPAVLSGGEDGPLPPGSQCTLSEEERLEFFEWLANNPEAGDAVLAQLTPVAPEHYPKDDTIVVKHLRGVLQAPTAAHAT